MNGAKKRRGSRSKLVVLSVFATILLCVVVYFIQTWFWGGLYRAIFVRGDVLSFLLSTNILLLVPAIYCTGIPLLIVALLFARADLPDGVPVTREMAPGLWKDVEDVAEAAGIAAPDKIVLVPEANAFAAEVPTRGLLAKPERVLGLGLPLLQVLSLQQAGAIIAHEMKHFRNRDGRFSLFTDTTAQIATALHQWQDDHITSNAISIPAEFYLNLYSKLDAAASQAAEFEADRLAAELFGEQATAEALIALNTLGHAALSQMSETMAQAWRAGENAPDSFTLQMSEAIVSDKARGQLQERLDHAMRSKTGRYDSHPSLSDRLSALGNNAPVLPSFDHELNAAKGLLRDAHEHLLGEMDAYFKSELGEAFEERRAQVQETVALLDQQMPLIESGETGREHAEIMSLIIEQTDLRDDGDYHARILSRFPDIPSSLCCLANAQVRAGNVDGAEAMLAAFENQPMMADEAAKFLHWARSMDGVFPFEYRWLEAWIAQDAIKQRIDAAFETFAKVDAACGEVIRKYELEPHGLADWHVERIVETVTDQWPVRRIWLARNTAVTSLGFAGFMMAIEVEGEPYMIPGITHQFCLPGPTFYEVSDSMSIGSDVERKKLLRYDGALIYDARTQQVEMKEAA